MPILGLFWACVINAVLLATLYLVLRLSGANRPDLMGFLAYATGTMTMCAVIFMLIALMATVWRRPRQ